MSNYSSEISERGKSIQNLLNSQNHKGALKAVVTNPPYGCTDPSLKSQDVKAVIAAFGQFKGEQAMTDALTSLSDDEVDIVMKYIYAALATGENSNTMLKWHELTLKRAGGLGCIIRVLADKVNTV